MTVAGKSARLVAQSQSPTPLAPPAKVSATDGAAHAFLEKIAQELARAPVNLPCFPDIVPRIREVITSPDSTAIDIVKVAATEPRLTARLLQTANSAVFNPSGVRFSDLRHAVTRLGNNLVQSVTMAFAFQQIKAEPALKPISRRLEELWEKSIAAASICRVLAERLHVPSDKVFLTGLMHGIGYFYIWIRAVQSSGGMDVQDLLTDFVRNNHPAIGRAVMEKWCFEEIMCEAVGNQMNYAHQSKRAADITDVLIASVFLAETLIEDGRDLKRWPEVRAFASLNLNPRDLDAILRHTELTLSSVRDALGC